MARSLPLNWRSSWWLVVGGWWLVLVVGLPFYQPPTTNHQPPLENCNGSLRTHLQTLRRQIDAAVVAVSGLAALRLPGPFQIQALHGAFRTVLRLPAGLHSPDLPSSQRGRAGGVRDECDPDRERYSDRRRVLFGFHQHSDVARVYFHGDHRPGVNLSRPCQQRYAALSITPVFALRVHHRQDVGAIDTAFPDHVGSGAVALPLQFLFRRRRLDV